MGVPPSSALSYILEPKNISSRLNHYKSKKDREDERLLKKVGGDLIAAHFLCSAY